VLITLALLGTTLAPAQDELKFENTRFTYGILGQSRKSDKFLPGDVVTLTFDVRGLKAKDDGMVSYSMGFEITKKGQKKPVQKREPTAMRTLNWLGGGDLPSFAYWPIPMDSESPGDYEMTITVTDANNAKKTATLKKAFTVEKPRLGFVRTAFTHVARADDPIPAPPVSVAGQTLLLHYSLVGFGFDKQDKTDVTVTIRVLDDKGNATLKKSLTSDIKNDKKDAPDIMVFRPAQIELNKPGKFKVELTAKCNVTQKTTKETLDLTVLEVK
jgi:hypothetical protein